MAMLMVARLTAIGFLLSPAAMLGTMLAVGAAERVEVDPEGVPVVVVPVVLAVGVEVSFAAMHPLFVSVFFFVFF